MKRNLTKLYRPNPEEMKELNELTQKQEGFEVLEKGVLIPGVKIRIFHYGCGQYTQYRRTEPRSNKTKCPKCGKLAEWASIERIKINPHYDGAWWPTAPEEKMGPRLRKMLGEV